MTTDQKYYLGVLQEEAAEIIQIVSKILRFGPDDYSPFDNKQVKNRNALVNEIAHLNAIVDKLHQLKFIKIDPVEMAVLKCEKLKKILYYMDRYKED